MRLGRTTRALRGGGGRSGLPGKQILVTGGVGHRLRIGAGHVEVDLAGGLLALRQGARVHALRARDAVQHPVGLAVVGLGVEVGDDRDDAALDGLVGGGGLPQGALGLVRQLVGADLQVADGPRLHDVAVGQPPLLPERGVGAGGGHEGQSRSRRGGRDSGGNGHIDLHDAISLTSELLPPAGTVCR
ncbi:Uncharacterised protein [Mycobacteroides abscessus subsp. bolletii]|nr:Uncharacterised protein [Mycobacteroides abscessus subsp. bolletii]SKH80212.1 Uncharacterised protein [Mycobacteroides abscessus subsp. bolletii]SKH94325.1 Uncharacterised protein [Mycobacteroides abscessus subsp. bolletii]SKJ78985.1 Uncharacterised protein [Mycobacteroides abscessus subsp. bolletii]